MSSDQGLSIFDEEPETDPDLDAEAPSSVATSASPATPDSTRTQVMPTVPPAQASSSNGRADVAGGGPSPDRPGLLTENGLPSRPSVRGSAP